MAKMRTIQPPHPSEEFTLVEARRAWRKVESANARAAAERVSAKRLPPVRLDTDDLARVAAEVARTGETDLSASNPQW